MWRVYMSKPVDRAKLLVAGFSLRNKHVSPRDVHPFREHNGVRITVKDVPLLVDDSVIADGLKRYGAKLLGPLKRDRLRVDGRLTNCETGDRFGFMQEPANLNENIPRNVELGGRWRARVFYRNQTAEKKCLKCLSNGHLIANCTSDWRCSLCNQLGHKRADCADFEPDDANSKVTAQEEQDNSDVPLSEAEHSNNAGDEPEKEDTAPFRRQRQITDFTRKTNRKKKESNKTSEGQKAAMVTRSTARSSGRNRGTRVPEPPSSQVHAPDPRVEEPIRAGRNTWSTPPGSDVTSSALK
ncbi:Hypp9407 [Branchiostoma lanceolatum]|uniref:Hypp9407 protein n=1 Tax=Branchiostoma lanceolatum TaxID=7740 RepID=A0A8S4MM84_BRALA|nr:Hypp9407 [Branchiostoma lanceolatum]